MFNIGFSELILILLVAFVIVGPKDLPKVARTLGGWVRKARLMFNEFKTEMELDEAIGDLKQMEKDVKSTLRAANPAGDIRKAEQDLKDAVRGAKDAAEGREE